MVSERVDEKFAAMHHLLLSPTTTCTIKFNTSDFLEIVTDTRKDSFVFIRYISRRSDLSFALHDEGVTDKIFYDDS